MKKIKKFTPGAISLADEEIRKKFGELYLCHAGNENGYEFHFSDSASEIEVETFLAGLKDEDVLQKAEARMMAVSKKESAASDADYQIKKLIGEGGSVVLPIDIQILILMRLAPAFFVDADLDTNEKVTAYANKKLAIVAPAVKELAKKIRSLEKLP